jgi:hypothetical protein
MEIFLDYFIFLDCVHNTIVVQNDMTNQHAINIQPPILQLKYNIKVTYKPTPMDIKPGK